MNEFPGAAFDAWLTTEPEPEYDSRCNCPWESGCTACWPEPELVMVELPAQAEC